MNHRVPARVLAAGLALCSTGVAQAEPRAWPDDFTTRLEALALVETLNADLLGHDSATLTLDRWCATHHLAPAGVRIVAQLDRSVTKSPTPEQLGLLAVTTPDATRYRRVRLSCGGHVVSEADNWYVPARLTAVMNDTLERTDTSFGRVVQALHFRRHTLSSNLLWRPLPEGWEMGVPVVTPPPGNLAIPNHLLEHRAVLTLPDGTPFSALVETYTDAVLDFPPPKQR